LLGETTSKIFIFLFIFRSPPKTASASSCHHQGVSITKVGNFVVASCMLYAFALCLFMPLAVFYAFATVLFCFADSRKFLRSAWDWVGQTVFELAL